MYGYKTEVPGSPTDHAIEVTVHKLRSISDLVIFQGNIDFHNRALVKDVDIGLLSSKYSENWAKHYDTFFRNICRVGV